MGLQVWNASGTLTYSSDSAAAGAFIGFYNIGSAGTVLTFPSQAGRSGVAVSTGGGGALSCTVDTNLGYPRFTFGAIAGWVGLFSI
jgi:hypothetical protein